MLDYYRLTKLAADALLEISDRVDEAPNNPMLKVQLAGRIRLESGDNVVDEKLLHGHQARLIFALLVMERDRPVHRDELAEALWPHGVPPTWPTVLRGVVSKIRRFLTATGLPETAVISGGVGTYQLQLPQDAVVDIELANSAVEAADESMRAGNPLTAVALTEYARTVASRPILPDATGRWIDSIRDCMREVLLRALLMLSEGYTQLGRDQYAIRSAEAAIAVEPFRERTYQMLMRLHAAAGNPAEALRAYERCRQLLAEELGVNPTGETASLFVALLQGQSRWQYGVQQSATDDGSHRGNSAALLSAEQILAKVARAGESPSSK